MEWEVGSMGGVRARLDSSCLCLAGGHALARVAAEFSCFSYQWKAGVECLTGEDTVLLCAKHRACIPSFNTNNFPLFYK